MGSFKQGKNEEFTFTTLQFTLGCAAKFSIELFIIGIQTLFNERLL